MKYQERIRNKKDGNLSSQRYCRLRPWTPGKCWTVGDGNLYWMANSMGQSTKLQCGTKHYMKIRLIQNCNQLHSCTSFT